MKNTSNLRNKLYNNYFRNQASRSGSPDLYVKIIENHKHLKKEIIPLIPSDKNINILDIGCGYGDLLLLLKDLGYKNTIGIDISDEQVKIAMELGINNVTQTDINTYLETVKDEIDLIIGIDIIEHFNKEELTCMLEKIKNSLKDGGMAIFRTPNTDAPFGTTYYFGDFTHESFLNYSSTEQLFLSAGFQKIKIMPSYIRVNGFIKNFIRGFLWFFIVLTCKIILFTSGKSSKTVLFTPNLIIKCNKRI